jgi:hypothetical protein
MRNPFAVCLIVFCSCAGEKYIFPPCHIESGNEAYEVLYNPYEGVDWENWKYCLAQHHDHVDTIVDKLTSYDNAGYNVLNLMHYAGDENNSDYRRERIWPFEAYFSFSSADTYYSKSKNLKLFIPAMEEVGFEHLLSPFMEQYIARFDPSVHQRKEHYHYSSTQEALDLIADFGGFGIIAHPTSRWQHYASLDNFRGIEIYNAYYEYKNKIHATPENYNSNFLIVWDILLRTKSTKIWGFSVNDHFGPYNYKSLRNGNEEIFDSGKIMVMVPDYDPGSYKTSLSNGSFYAIHDYGFEKNRYPMISSVGVDESSITIETDAQDVRWFYCRQEISMGRKLDLGSLPRGMNYVRAEVTNESGKIFLQPFSIVRR